MRLAETTKPPEGGFVHTPTLVGKGEACNTPTLVGKGEACNTPTLAGKVILSDLAQPKLLRFF